MIARKFLADNKKLMPCGALLGVGTFDSMKILNKIKTVTEKW